MSAVATEAALSDQVYIAFLRGDDLATEKHAEMNNVEVIKDAYDAFVQGDADKLLALMDEDIDWHIAGPDSISFAGSNRGRNAVRRVLEKSFATVKNQQPEVRDVIAQGDTVTVIGHERGQCSTNNQEYESYWIHVFTLRDGKIIKFREYLDTAAMKDAFASK
jgi:ketosteroid isomerase-like protein